MDLEMWDEIKHNKQFGASGVIKHKEIYPQLSNFFDVMKKNHQVVTVNILCAEHKRLADKPNISNEIKRHKIYRWMSREGICN